MWKLRAQGDNYVTRRNNFSLSCSVTAPFSQPHVPQLGIRKPLPHLQVCPAVERDIAEGREEARVRHDGDTLLRPLV